MASKFSRSGKATAKTLRPTTEADVLRAMPEFVVIRKSGKRDDRKTYGIPEDRLLAILKQADPELTLERLRELLGRIRQGGSIEQGLFPTSQGSEQGWRRKW